MENKHFRTFATAAALCLGLAGSAYAQDSQGKNNRFYLQPETVTINPETNMGEVCVWLDNETDNFNSFFMAISLPEGFTIETNSKGKVKSTINNDEDEGKAPEYVIAWGNGTAPYTVLGYSPDEYPVETGNDWLFKFNIIAPEGFAADTRAVTSTVQGTISRIEISTMDRLDENGDIAEDGVTHYMPDIEFSIQPESMDTSVGEVEGAAPDAPAYDVLGRRVDARTYRGVVIRGGRKTINC